MSAPQIVRKTHDGNYLKVLRPDADKLLHTYSALKMCKTVYNIIYGGGGSGKSHALGQFFVRRLCETKHKLLVIRKFGTSLNDSVIDLFLEVALPFWGLRKDIDYAYNGSKRKITFLKTGSSIIFRGLDNPEKLKSISGVSLVWVEEASEINEHEFNIMSDRIRGEIDPQIYLSFNPISERHWLKERFMLRNPRENSHFEYYRTSSRISVIFSTYVANPFVGQKYREDMAWYQIHKPEHYRVYGLGRWGIIRPDKPFFTAFKPTIHIGKTEYNPLLPVCLTWDFNVNNTCTVSQHYDDGQVVILKTYHGEDDLEGLCRMIVEKYGNLKEYRFSGDASGNNQSAYTPGNQSAYELIQSYFHFYGAYFLDFGAVPTSNGETSESRKIANALISYFGSKLTIDRDECSVLIEDIERMEAKSNGSLNKALCDKHDYGHAGDTFRYLLKHFEAETYAQIVGLIRYGEDLDDAA